MERGERMGGKMKRIGKGVRPSKMERVGGEDGESNNKGKGRVV